VSTGDETQTLAVADRPAEEYILLREERDRFERRIHELERIVSLQPQTGLPTRFRLDVELEEIIDSMSRSEAGDGFSLLIVQLGENYRAVRKTLKTSVSEWILYQTGCRIAALLGIDDRVFHTHENEFVLILPGRKGRELAAFLKRLVARLAEPHIFSGYNIAIGAATGAAYWPEHALDRSALLHEADIAAGAATEERKSFVLFRPELLRKVVDKVELQNSLIRAIEQPTLERIGEQFTLFYQPKLVASSMDGRTIRVERVEAEALIRWMHPTRGLLHPSTFIPLAEETGLIMPLGKWLIYQCARRLESWDASGDPGISISLNLSARQFRSEEISEVLSSAIAAAGIAPGRITVELTETSLFEDPCTAARMLRRFTALGLRVSVDDFGTGYSSLSHLHRFPLDEIKIDRLFIENLDGNRQDRIIIQSLVGIARGLGLSLVAEGVERPEAMEALWEMGCRGFQGYLISLPLSAEDFIAFRRKIESYGMLFSF
jgi:EAL domain-containing protein (putative c-di-GMP-specific phosphodiesterase class I)/GGDEF domain-containing protein